MGLHPPSAVQNLHKTNPHKILRLSELLQSLILLFGDVVAGIIAASLCVSFLNITDRQAFDWGTWIIWLSFWILWRAYQGLYPGYSRSPQTELRLHTVGTIQLLGAQLAAAFAAHQLTLSVSAILLQWLVILILALPLRYILRMFMIRTRHYGRPISIIGGGEIARLVIHQLKANSAYGLRPIAVYDDNPMLQGKFIEGVPVLGKLEDALIKPITDQALISIPSARAEVQQRVINSVYLAFPVSWIIPDLIGVPNQALQPHNVGSIATLEIKNNLRSIRSRFVKRFIDLFLSFMGILLLLPIFVLISFFVFFDSKGPIIYKANRVGKNGKPFPCYKFRSMYSDAEHRLQDLLNNDPLMRIEYETFHKLKKDPRVTNFGSILRKTSLDEIPQLFNVFIGQMSLVGPRPYLLREFDKMGEASSEILTVRPGITGYWQVNERNESTFEKRLLMDKFYISNWSIWLDIIILISTIKVVVFGKGAY